MPNSFCCPCCFHRPCRKAKVRPSINMDAEKDEDPTSVSSTQPVVKMEPLMFYRVCFEIAKPTKLVPKNSAICRKIKMGFMARREDFDDILRTRFCLWRPQHPQVDHLPRHLNVTVNRKKCFVLKEKESNQRPINITDLVRFSDVEHNVIKATWSLTDRREYAMSVCWVKPLTTDNLLQELRAKDVFPANKTRAIIREKLASHGEEEPAPSSLRISLICPLGGTRVSVPCRALSCSHLQTFDAIQYLKWNEDKETWRCPICVKRAYFRNLLVDEFFIDILNTSPNCEDIELLPDGSWYPVEPRRDTDDSNAPGPSGLQGPPPASNSEIPMTAPRDCRLSNVELQIPATTVDTPTSMTMIVARRHQQPSGLFWGLPQGRNLQHSRSPLSSPEAISTRAFHDLNVPSRCNIIKPPYDWSFTSQTRCDYCYNLTWRPAVPAPAPAPALAPPIGPALTPALSPAMAPPLGPALAPAPAPAPAIGPAPALPLGPAPTPAPPLGPGLAPIPAQALASGPYAEWLPPPLPCGIYHPSSQQASVNILREGGGRGRGVPTFRQVAGYQPPPLINFPPMVQILSPTVAMVSTLGGQWRGAEAMPPMPPTYVASADPKTGAIFTQAGRASSSRVNVGQSIHAGGIVSTRHGSDSEEHRCQ
uniref:SP-RING-type domain-containing protein n=1 Tax=Ornithorhynchus anatinus TaxID=9258 RepID=A0A6I8NLI2_ORNAN